MIFLSFLMMETQKIKSIDVQLNCSLGCLKCKDNNCVFCDFTNEYYLENKKCVKKKVENCTKLNFRGECIECKQYYFLVDGVCTAVPETLKKEECIVMKNSIECKYCKTGYYPSQGVCVKATDLIENCKYYSDTGKTCEVCEENTFMYVDQRFCIYLESFDGCAFWSQINCKTCLSNFFFNKNGYLNTYFNEELNQDQIYQYIDFITNKNNHGFVSKFCQKSFIENCEVYESAQECKKCKSDYILYNNQCIYAKTSNFQICKIQDVNGSCQECNQGFFLSNGECTKVSSIPNCISFDGKASFSLCQECDKIYFLDRNVNKCVKRTISDKIEFCQSQNLYQDNCHSCQEGYQITNDSLKCLPQISNCKSYKPSNIYSEILLCQSCNLGFYKAFDECVKGTQSNCSEYHQYSNECITCENGYYLNSSKTCMEHSLKDQFKCKNFSNKVNNQCIGCDFNQIKINNRNFCQNITTAIPNCVRYLTPSTCQTCEEGYSLSTDQLSCTLLPVLHCKKMADATNCAQCLNYTHQDIQIPYILSQDKLTCLPPYTNPFSNCNSTKIQDQTALCHSCSENHYPKQVTYPLKFCVKSDDWMLDFTTNQSKIENCEIYDKRINECLKCQDGKLVEGGACVDACSSGSYLHLSEIVIDQSINKIKLGKQNYCAVNTMQNCELFDTSVRSSDNTYSGTPVIGCVKCQTGFLPVIDPNNLTYAGQATNWHQDVNKRGVLNRYSFINECVDETTVTSNLLKTDTSVNNCDYFIKSSTNKFGCFSCSFGFTGIVEEQDDTYFINQCMQMNSCDTTKWYHALKHPYHNMIQINNYLKFPLSLYFSCHQCGNENEVVFAGLSSGASRTNNSPASPVGGISNYDLTSEPPYLGNTETQTTCSVPDPTLNIPQNCAMVIILTDLLRKGYTADNQSENDSGYKCISCKAGYIPSYDDKKFINQCVPMENCEIPQFNGCKQCKPNYSFIYSMNHRTHFHTSCLDSSTVPYCFSGVQTQTLFYCKECQEGYVSNMDGHCDKMEIENCINYAFNEGYNIISFYPLEIEVFEKIKDKRPAGCNQCSQGYLAVEMDDLIGSNICLQNTHLAEKGTASSSKFVENCLMNYYEENQNKIRCLKCKENFALVSGKCIEIQVDPELEKIVGECKVFNYYTKRCDECKDEHFLNGGICYKGYLANCQIYQTMNQCLKCHAGFVALTLNSHKTICFEISEIFNCEEWNKEASSIGELECERCKENMFPSYEIQSIPNSICFDIKAVENCAQHELGYNNSHSSFNCSKCQDGYYLIDNFCLSRQILNNCQKYHPNKDECQICNDGYQLTNKGDCQASLMSNIIYSSCEFFFEKDKCLKCAPNFYLDPFTNDCKEVSDSQLINNCLYYRSKSECSQCKQNYFLQNQYCIEASAVNCVEYESITQCKSCPENYGFKKNGDILSCVSVSIENCKQHNPEVHYPFQCLICNDHFYLSDEKICKPVDQAIEFCEIYSDGSHCQKCEDRRALSETKDGCFASNYIMKKTDPNCAQSFLKSLPQCQVCGYGRFWEGGKCRSCLYLPPDSGCMLCNPVNQFECLICMPNYFMNQQGDCIREPSTIEVQQDQQIEDFVKIMVIKIIILALI